MLRLRTVPAEHTAFKHIGSRPKELLRKGSYYTTSWDMPRLGRAIAYEKSGRWFNAEEPLLRAKERTDAGSSAFRYPRSELIAPLSQKAAPAFNNRKLHMRLPCTVHRLLFKLIFVLAAIHITVIAAYLLFRRENLIRPMVTGRKPVPAGMEVASPRSSELLSAALVFGLEVSLVVLLLRTV